MKEIIHGSILRSLVLGAVLLTSHLALASDKSVLDRIKVANEPFDTMKIDSAHPLSMKTVRSNEPYQGGTFKVLARKDSIERFRCSGCHKDKKVQVRDGASFTHGDIVLNHGPDSTSLSCSDCHNEKERDFLVGKKGQKIDFDHSYQLCGKCHFRQKSDWVGGAHGKRVKYWAGERVVYNCATCHNPHSPRFKKRMPATFSRPLDE